MTNLERKRTRQTWAVGLLLTAAVAVASLTGSLNALENAWYDARVRWFQFYTPASNPENSQAADRIAVVHIDQPALQQVGSWPWPRAHLARVVDQLDAAGANVIALDLLFTEPQQPRFAVDVDGQPGQRIHDDRELAKALARTGRSIVPVNLPLPSRERDKSRTPRQLIDAAAEQLREDLSQQAAAVRAVLNARDQTLRVSEGVWEDAFVSARERVMREAVHAALAAGVDDPAAAFARILPQADAEADSVLRRLFQHLWQRAQAERAMLRFGRAVDPLATLAPEAEGIAAPIPEIAEAAGGSGFINWGGEGAVRSLPLWVEHEGRAYPQFGLAVAMQMLNVSAADVQFEPGRVILPRGEDAAPLIIPTHAEHDAAGKPRGHHMVVPWYGPAEWWEVMFDIPDHTKARGQVPLLAVWEVAEAERRLAENRAEAVRAIESVLAVMDPSGLASFREQQSQLEPDAAGQAIKQTAHDVLNDESIRDMVAYAADLRDEGEALDEVTLGLLEWYQQLERITEANADLQAVRDERQQWLRERVADRAVFVGWTATGAVVDLVNTPLHTECPGVMVHAAVAQAIMHDHFWRSSPRWWGLAALLIVSILIIASVATFLPLLATLASLLVAGGWALLDGLLIFDMLSIVMPGAAPLVGTAVVWGGCVAWRYLVERTERSRITRRFSSYVDPALVEFVVNHPEQGQLEGEVRELTVVFTDLAGFTTLSERLGGQTVALLNEYMGLMVPLIRQHGGFVNKFLGDGIMFFYGAPVHRHDHAADAVATVLAMQQAMHAFNESLAERGMIEAIDGGKSGGGGGLGMRAGVATGSMIVGDAGPPDASDYTVLGDTVNLAARLESANKAVGTRTLITARTLELVGENRYAVRPIGRLQVVGKQEGVAVYEPLGPADAVDADTQQLIDETRAMVDAFQDGRFDDCLTAARTLEHHAPSEKLIALYRKACEAQREDPDTFTGQIVLTEK